MTPSNDSHTTTPSKSDTNLGLVRSPTRPASSSRMLITGAYDSKTLTWSLTFTSPTNRKAPPIIFPTIYGFTSLGILADLFKTLTKPSTGVR